MKPQSILTTTLLALLCAAATATANTVIDTVTIGNPGNPADTNSLNSNTGLPDLGGVSYTYGIGKYDVTLTQYCVFLNAVAKTDTYGLYSTSLTTDLNVAGISRSGSSGNYNYAVIGSGQRPVTYVSWLDAARYCNWLHNGQPTGLQTAATTEAGAYTLNGDTTRGLEIHNSNALYWIPTENEWYKAAYYDPGIAGANKYWTYATRSNVAPGNIVGSGANMANYYTNMGSHVYSVTQSGSFSGTQNCLTDVGAFTGSASAYGLFDQNGDVWNWNDATFFSSRGLRGGSWFGGSSNLLSSTQGADDPTLKNYDVGFRIATVATAPEPASAVLLLGGGALLALRRRRA